MGNVMKDDIAAHSLPDEYFVIQIDGRAKSHHRRFLDALRQACNSETSFRITTSKFARRMVGSNVARSNALNRQ